MDDVGDLLNSIDVHADSSRLLSVLITFPLVDENEQRGEKT